MPIWEVQGPTGDTIEIESDQEPSEEHLTGIFSDISGKKPIPAPAPGWNPWEGEVSPELKATAPWLVPQKPVPRPSLEPVVEGGAEQALARPETAPPRVRTPEAEAKLNELRQQMQQLRAEGRFQEAELLALDLAERTAYTARLTGDPITAAGMALEAAGAKPAFTPEQVESAIRFVTPGGPPPAGTLGAGVEKFLSENISGMSRPEAAMGLMTGKLAGPLFLPSLVTSSPEAVQRLTEAQTPEEFGKAGLETLLTVGAPLGIVAHMQPRGVPPPDIPGSALRMPRGAEPPVPPPPAQLAAPDQAALTMAEMQRRIGAGYEPPPPPRPVLPEGPSDPRVTEARQKGADTINKVLDLFPEMEGNREAARVIRDQAFPTPPEEPGAAPIPEPGQPKTPPRGGGAPEVANPVERLRKGLDNLEREQANLRDIERDNALATMQVWVDQMKKQGVPIPEELQARLDGLIEKRQQEIRGPAKAKTLTPAIISDEGKIIESGENHGEARLKHARAGRMAVDLNKEGYVDENGNFLTRNEGAKRFEEITGKKPANPESLTSEDLKAAGMLEHLKKAAAPKSIGKQIVLPDSGPSHPATSAMGNFAPELVDLASRFLRALDTMDFTDPQTWVDLVHSLAAQKGFPANTVSLPLSRIMRENPDKWAAIKTALQEADRRVRAHSQPLSDYVAKAEDRQAAIQDLVNWNTVIQIPGEIIRDTENPIPQSVGGDAVMAGAPPLGAKPPLTEPATATSFDPAVATVVEVPIDQVVIHKDIPNFKEDADPTTGVVPSERLEATRYERLGTAPIVLWKKLNGELEVITGRHRIDLAKRLGEKTIPAQIVEEAKGFTKAMAMTFDAEANIRDGQGSVRDYAHYFKNTPDLTEQEARSRGLLSRAKGKAGWDLAKAASDDLYALWRDDKITEPRALAIVRAAPGDAAKQQLGIRLAQEGKTPEFIRARLERERAKAESPVQTDMFGNPVFDDAKADEEAATLERIRKELRAQILAVQAAAKNPVAAAKLGVDVKDPAGVLKRVAELKAELERWDGAWWLQPDLVAKLKGQPPPQAPGAAPVPVVKPKPPTAPATGAQGGAAELAALDRKRKSGAAMTKAELDRLAELEAISKKANADAIAKMKKEMEAQKKKAAAKPKRATMADIQEAIAKRNQYVAPENIPGKNASVRPDDPKLGDIYKYGNHEAVVVDVWRNSKGDLQLSLLHPDKGIFRTGEGQPERFVRENKPIGNVFAEEKPVPAPGEPMMYGVPKSQWEEMARYNDREQRERWGTTRSELMAKAATGKFGWKRGDVALMEIQGMEPEIVKVDAVDKTGKPTHFRDSRGVLFENTGQKFTHTDRPYVSTGPHPQDAAAKAAGQLTPEQRKKYTELYRVESELAMDKSRIYVPDDELVPTTDQTYQKLKAGLEKKVLAAGYVRGEKSGREFWEKPRATGETPAAAAAPKPFFTPEEQAEVDALTEKLKKHISELPEQLSVGVPINYEFIKDGSRIAYLYIKAGVRRFGDFADQVLNTLGERARPFLLSWYTNAKILYKGVKDELDSEATAQRIYGERYGWATAARPDFSGILRGSSPQGGRPGIRFSGEHLIPKPREYVDANSYAARSNFRLDEQQVLGVNLILDLFHKAQQAAFLLADGTGFGKTAQILAVADQYIRRGLGKRILIVTQNAQVLKGRFLEDAERMGVNPDLLTLTTYTSLAKLPSKEWDLIIFDEAHNLKNAPAQKSVAASQLRANHKIFATATPMDRFEGAPYFLAEVTGRSQAEVGRQLGYQLIERVNDRTGETYVVPTLLPGFEWPKVWANIMSYRDAVIQSGAMVRREYPFYGKANTIDLTMDEASSAEHSRLIRYYDSKIAQSVSPLTKARYAGQKTMTLGRWSEQQKLRDAVNMAVEHIRAGGQAIIVAETDKAQSFPIQVRDSVPEIRTNDRGEQYTVWVTDGALTKIEKMLNAAGITDIAHIHDPKKAGRQIYKEVRLFQNGERRVAIATPQSGGTGIDLDDTTGNRPRLMVVLSKNFAGDSFEQLVGRVSRKNTKSPSEVRFLNLDGAYGDMRRDSILEKKINTLKAIQGGEELDVAAGLDTGEPGGVSVQKPGPRPKAPPAGMALNVPREGASQKIGGMSPKEVQELLDRANPNDKMMYSGIPVPDLRLIWDSLSEVVRDLAPETRKAWRSFSMQTLPRITDSHRPAGEAGARLAAAPMVARALGEQFSERVTEGVTIRDFDKKFGTGLTEDNLRDLRRVWNEKADEAENRDEIIQDLREQIAELKEAADEGDIGAVFEIRRMRSEIRRLSKLTDADALLFRQNADNVTTTIGAENSPFPTEAAYREFMEHPETQDALRRHIALWEQQKEPLYREAADIDPEVELQTRGLDYGARINLKNVLRDNGTPTTVGPAVKSPLIRATATLRRRDPFAQVAKGAGSYEGSYREIMANGFGREYPVAKQHEFIRQLIAGGDAVIRNREFEPTLEIKGEATKGYPLRIRPWANRFLHIRKSMAPEYEDATGLSAQARLGIYSKAADVLTRSAVQGLAEGSTHVSNLLMQVFTGLGPTADPMINALLKSAGRADLLYSLPKIIINSFANRKADMLELAQIGAAKEPYRGGVGWFITKIDHGVRLYAADVYKGMAEKGLVPKTETGLREFVNQVGQYNKRLQPRWIQFLRSTGIQPFATAMQTFNIQGLRNLAIAPGARGTSPAAALALRADKAAGILGFVVMVTALNYLVSGTPTGPAGTKLGAVGWVGDDKRVHQLDLGALTGMSRGPRTTGLQGYVEAKRLGLPTGSAVVAGGKGFFNTIISAGTGPANRFLFLSATGKRPAIPPVQEAPVMPPQRDFSVLKSQTAANIIEAAKQANPVVDATVRLYQGKYEEALTRQLSRYTPRAGMQTETVAHLPRIVEASELKAYTEALAKEARRMPLDYRRVQFINKRLADDGLDAQMRARAIMQLRREGIFLR